MEDLGLQFANSHRMNSQSEAVPTVVPRDTLCTKCLKCIKDWLLVDFKKETILLVKLAGPVFMSQLLGFLINFVSAVFCGHLGVTELAAVAYAIAVINVTGVSIGTGLATVFDTLISQTYGSGNLKHVGVILQRGVLIQMLTCFPCWAILINLEHILLAVKQSPEVARSVLIRLPNAQYAHIPSRFIYIYIKYLFGKTLLLQQLCFSTL
uniref:Multidrug and toxin extrusion protein 1 n=1 Tax=Sander lucioperca TaxID=283035 RepID=A0A8C9X2C8_SANLU